MGEIDEIIKKAVKSTISGLKAEKLLKESNYDTFRRTEELLRNYNALSLSEDPAAAKMMMKIEAALSSIKKDPYYEIVPLYYIGGRTREELADRFDTSVTTISRNKSRLIRKLKVVLFSDDYIREVYRNG